MTYTIVTDEPIEKWCRPVHEGQVVDVLVSSPLKHSPGQWTTPVKHRYMSTSSASGELEWIEMPIHWPSK